ncbi:2-oxo acid dehydrogenase subunit E2 [Arthrobacter frigidicola]|nr:2-oxo acid dehydrogenase subunit E2 [Arthrobacter frigidicola]
MPALMNMPEVMANALEATLSVWLKKEGDHVTAGEAIAEVETEKATVEIEADSNGVIAGLLVEEGASVEVGAPILLIKASGDTDSQVADFKRRAGTDGHAIPAATSEAEAIETNTPVVIGAKPTHAPDTPRPAREPEQRIPGHGGRLFSSPLARRLAKENLLDLDAITGTGPGGRIIRRDIEQAIAGRNAQHALTAAASTPSPAAEPAPARESTAPEPSGESTAVPHTRMRRAIARRLTESKSTVPHFYLTAQINMDALLALRQQINQSSVRRITVNDLIVKAAGLALSAVPEANVTWTEDAQLQHSSANISVAIAVDGGLLTPVVRHVESSSLSSISTTIADFVSRAKSGRIRQEELTGGSFSVTNLGMFGTGQFTAILNPPQSAILAVGAAEPRAVVLDGELAVATMMTCTLSADHRVIDGAIAAQWMQSFKTCLENPLTILL